MRDMKRRSYAHRGRDCLTVINSAMIEITAHPSVSNCVLHRQEVSRLHNSVIDSYIVDQAGPEAAGSHVLAAADVQAARRTGQSGL